LSLQNANLIHKTPTEHRPSRSRKRGWSLCTGASAARPHVGSRVMASRNASDDLADTTMRFPAECTAVAAVGRVTRSNSSASSARVASSARARSSVGLVSQRDSTRSQTPGRSTRSASPGAPGALDSLRRVNSASNLHQQARPWYRKWYCVFQSAWWEEHASEIQRMQQMEIEQATF
jgi:hypothetical protein